MTIRTANFNPYKMPLNLTGMSQAERKAYVNWINAEEYNIRRTRMTSKVTPEVSKFHNKLNVLTHTLLKG